MELLHHEHGRIVLPDFILGGVAKAATTTLYRLLAQHPHLFMPDNKEPYFFSFDGPPRCSADDLRQAIIWRNDDYLKLFEGATPGRILGEASTSYFYTYRVSIPKLKAWYGDKATKLKIVGVLRNPIDRAYSHYMYLRNRGHESLAFAEAIRPEIVASRLSERLWDYDYLNYGRYADQVQAYLEAFPHCRFFLVEDLADLRGTYRDLCGFLGIPFSGNQDFGMRANPSGEPRSAFLVQLLTDNVMLKRVARSLIPGGYRLKVATLRDRVVNRLLRKNDMDHALRMRLIDWYRDDVQRLQFLLGRDLSAWLR